MESLSSMAISESRTPLARILQQTTFHLEDIENINCDERFRTTRETHHKIHMDEIVRYRDSRSELERERFVVANFIGGWG